MASSGHVDSMWTLTCFTQNVKVLTEPSEVSRGYFLCVRVRCETEVDASRAVRCHGAGIYQNGWAPCWADVGGSVQHSDWVSKVTELYGEMERILLPGQLNVSARC